MTITPPSRRALLTGLTLAPALAMPSIVRAQSPIKWRMVTSWSKGLPGPGTSAIRLAKTINTMSGGRLEVQMFAAGEIVPAFGVFDAVSTGTAEMGHTASVFWYGKIPTASYFCTVPFGLSPVEHHAWIEHGGGQELWDELYAPYNMRAFLAGNSGPCMLGWFKNEIKSPEDFKGMRVRSVGMGSEVFKRLGAVPLAIPTGEVGIALERGTIDAVELLAPVNDAPQALYRSAPYYLFPGFNKPNAVSEALVGNAAWEKLPRDLQEIVRIACIQEHAAGMADAEYNNAAVLLQLVQEQGVKPTRLPPEVIKAAREAATSVLSDHSQKDAISKKVYDAYQTIQKRQKLWSAVLSSYGVLK
jgi:TRAP-type mannitol/chloroaromatic compound transport system substrate-binding protein